VEELYCNFEDLILVYSHHHYEVSESEVANLDVLLIVNNCELKPLVLIFEKFTVKVGDSSS